METDHPDLATLSRRARPGALGDLSIPPPPRPFRPANPGEPIGWSRIAVVRGAILAAIPLGILAAILILAALAR